MKLIISKLIIVEALVVKSIDCFKLFISIDDFKVGIFGKFEPVFEIGEIRLKIFMLSVFADEVVKIDSQLESTINVASLVPNRAGFPIIRCFIFLTNILVDLYKIERLSLFGYFLTLLKVL